MGKTKTFKTFAECEKQAHRDMVRANALTLNHTAFETSELSKKNIQNDFTNRNDFTKKRVGYTPCKRANDIADLKSMAGIDKRAGYMERQEKGGAHVGTKGKDDKLMIPSTFARGGSNSNKVVLTYKKIVKKIIKTQENKYIHRSRKSNLVAQAYMAHKINGFMKQDNEIFKVTEFQKNGDNVSFERELIYNFKFHSTDTKANPWLQPAAFVAAAQMQVYFNRAMDES